MDKLPTGQLDFVIEPYGDSVQLSSVSERLQGYTEEAIAHAKKAITQLGTAFSDAVAEIPAECDYVDLKFALKFDAQAGIVISKVGTQASFEVTLRVKPKRKNG